MGNLAQITYSNDIGKRKVGDYLWLLWAKGSSMPTQMQ